MLAAQAMGADMAYIGSAFIATQEARALDAYKQMIVDSSAKDIVYSNYFTGIPGNYLKPSIVKAGHGPGRPAGSRPVEDGFRWRRPPGAKAWKDIWGCGQGIGAVKEVGRWPTSSTGWSANMPTRRPHCAADGRLTAEALETGREPLFGNANLCPFLGGRACE